MEQTEEVIILLEMDIKNNLNKKIVFNIRRDK